MKIEAPPMLPESDPASAVADAKAAKGDVAIAKASQEFESLVVGELLKTMRKTISTANKQGFDAQIATSMFDEELAKHIATTGAFGIGNVMTQSLSGKVTPHHATDGLHAIADKSDGSWSQPVDAMPTSFATGQRFGAERVGHQHQGLDIAEPVGTPVHAVHDGTVVGVGRDENSSGGLQVKIAHDDGYITKYMHLDSIVPNLAVGKKINAGSSLGTVGDTGTSSHGTHLHFEIEKNGAHIDPEPYVKKWSVP